MRPEARTGTPSKNTLPSETSHLLDSAIVLLDLAGLMRQHAFDEILIVTAAVAELQSLVNGKHLRSTHPMTNLAGHVIASGRATPEELHALADFLFEADSGSGSPRPHAA
ncbi:Uncharacterised protein [Mycobacteroides abscessus subsp. bolletii]|nr:Uncharacterised protein [Mycobacteroides abscessus subsp. bolletii]SLD80009.1 Uncharacterised protein [Mycobacteroides abscessus subsp. bolletii]SLD86944.1 Uncharacterised protein [Mycobacteroides abscessus subsp. bolletii]